jgi:hypothetical protein
MGKNWKGHGGGRGGGGGSGDLTSCRGFAGVLGTCDAAREKESNKELTNLLQQTIERIYPVVAEDSIDSPQESDSIADMIKSEVAQLKSKKQGGGQDVVSINTGIKGIVFVKISRRDICPVKLIKAIFDQVKADKVPCTRHVVRIIPLQLAFFPNDDEFSSTAKMLVECEFEQSAETQITLPRLMLNKAFSKRKAAEVTGKTEESGAEKCKEAGGQLTRDDGDCEPDRKRPCVESAEESVVVQHETSAPPQEPAVIASGAVVGEPEEKLSVAQVVQKTVAAVAVPVMPATANLPVVRYMVQFKARNHNTLTKNGVLQKLRECMPPHVRQNYMDAQVGDSAV